MVRIKEKEIDKIIEHTSDIVCSAGQIISEILYQQSRGESNYGAVLEGINDIELAMEELAVYVDDLKADDRMHR